MSARGFLSRWVGLGAATLVLLLTAGALAGGTRFWRQTTSKDFEEGEATASVVLPTGEVAPGLRGTRLPVEASFIYSGALSADGKTAYFGGGDQGRIFVLGLGKSPPTVKKLPDLDAPWITALVVRRDGSLLAGTTPGGRVFVIDPVKGEAKVFAKLPSEHVWAMAHDPTAGITYVGAGAKGVIYALDKDGRGAQKPYWDSGDKQVGSLLIEPGGTLLAGTSSEAIVYRISKDKDGTGRAEALHDFDADEIRALLRVGDATYIAVNDFLDSSDSAAAAATPKGTKVTTAPGAPAAIGGATRSAAKARAAVYRLAASGPGAGAIEQVFTLADGYLTALGPGEPASKDGSSSVLAASGTQGKVYRLLPDRTFTLAADLSERQALVLLPVADGFLIGTGDVGGVYELRPAAAGQASYLSKVFDGEVLSRWGRLRYTGTKGISFDTRSGNTAKPDKSWTDWKKLGAGAGGSPVVHDGWDGEGQVASPAARYLQYRASFAAGSPLLKEVTLAYLPQNLRARVSEVTLDGGTLGASPSSTWRTHSALLKLRWRVENPDGDGLIYRLWYRQEKESVWRPLGGPEPLTKTEYDWNTDSVPDGRYLVRVWATDERANPGDRALDNSFVSPPFLVDNTRPEVGELKQKGAVITGRARDAASIITAVEFSVDGEDWRPVTPSDGLWDQKEESFALHLPRELKSGPHVVNVRAADATDNNGTARLEVTLP